MAHALADAGERRLDDFSTGYDWPVPQGATVVVGNAGDQMLVMDVMSKHEIDVIIHFAGSIVVTESIADPLGYYRNNTLNLRALIECAARGGVKHFIFSSTAGLWKSGQDSSRGIRSAHADVHTGRPS